MIDIRSDTVTQPTPEMRAACAQAEVGDDVYGDDPTMRRLEEYGAALLGKEASLFVPSGTFGNQLALFTWCPRGTEVILGEECHIIQHEAGAASVIAGVQTRTISAPDGVLPPEEIRARIRERDIHFPVTSLICVENSHSLGKAVPLSALDGVWREAKKSHLPVHLDGARIFNAAAALGIDAKEIAARADSVMVCLSKGLCAPVGSLLAGTRAFVEEARFKRKIMGGGLRQAGVLAAAGLIALEKMTNRMAEDHERARQIAHALQEIPALEVDLESVQTNMVFFRVKNPPPPAETADIVKAFAKEGIIINPPESAPGCVFRFVTHYWIGDKETAAVISAARKIF